MPRNTHVPVKNVVNLNTKEYSKDKCMRNLTTELDDLIQSVIKLMKKEEKCDIIENKANKLINIEKPEKKKKKVATTNVEKRVDKLRKEMGATRAAMLLLQ
jgi:hypothetical protein